MAISKVYIPECLHRHQFNKVLNTLLKVDSSYLIRELVKQTYDLEKSLESQAYCEALGALISKFGAEHSITQKFMDHLAHHIGLETSYIKKFLRHSKLLDHSLLLQSIQHKEEQYWNFIKERKGDIFCAFCKQRTVSEAEILHENNNFPPKQLKCCHATICELCYRIYSSVDHIKFRCKICEMQLQIPLTYNVEESSVYACCKKNNERRILGVSLDE